jgi:hypothetical protein
MMMKRLLGLVLVLAIVSSAYGAASIQVLVDGVPLEPGQNVKPSQVITMNLLESAGKMNQFSAMPMFGVGVDHGDLEALRLTPPTLGTIKLVDPENDGFAVRGNATYVMVDVQNGIALGFDFHVPEDLEISDYINISWAGNYGGFAPDDIAIHVIPEPMTIGLLGLGGLALLRRRK